VRSLLWVLLALGLVALGVVYLQESNLTIESLSGADTSSLTLKLVMAAGVAVIVLALFRERISQVLKYVLIWAAISLALAIGYTYRFEVRETADRVMAEFVPGHAATRGGSNGRTVEIARGQGGNFTIQTRVNGARLAMVFDTGASSVVLTTEAAKAAGLPLEVLKYSINVDTANGRTRAAPVTLQSIAVGGITEREIPALIAQPGQLRQSLLGMSFLNRLEGWEVRGDRLVLRAYP
jgi:aspartyl protease family protein